MNELVDFLNDRIKNPVTLEEEAQLLIAVMDGSISVTVAKQIYSKLYTKRIENMNKLLSLTQEEILEVLNDGT